MQIHTTTVRAGKYVSFVLAQEAAKVKDIPTRELTQDSLPLGGLVMQQLANQIHRVLRKVGRKADLAVHDLSIGLHGVLVVERRIAAEHFIYQDAQRPPVNTYAHTKCKQSKAGTETATKQKFERMSNEEGLTLAVAFARNDLRSQVVRGATQCVGTASDDLGKAEIGDFEVTLAVEQQVFRFQVTVNDVARVHVLKRQNHRSGIEASSVFIKESSEDVATHNPSGEETRHNPIQHEWHSRMR